MKILLVSPSLRMGGSERVVSLLSQELSKNHQILLAIFNSREIAFPYNAEIIDLACPAKHGSLGKINNFIKRIKRLYHLIKIQKPDLIISFMESANFPTSIASLLAGTLSKTEISVHSNPKFFSKAQKLFIRIIYPLSRRVIVVSQGIAHVLESYHIPQNKIVHIPNPISVEQISLLSKQEPAILSSLPSNFILGVGRLHVSKGFDQVIRAFSKVSKQNLHLVVLGSGEEKENLLQLVHKLEIVERVHFVESVENPFPFFRKALCFILSSKYEGFPLVLLEALACGCPIISYDCEYGPGELIQDGFNGILVKNGDVEGLTKSIERVLGDQSLRNKLITNGNKIIYQYDIQSIAKRYITIP